MSTKNRLPNFQFPGQIVVDNYGVVYKYDDKADCFVDTGSIEDIPESSFDDSGLMIPRHKSKLDLIPEKAGGFAIIIDPKLRPNSVENPDGLIYGDLTLTSESIDITCIDSDGGELSGECIECINNQDPPGLNFQLSEKFLDHFCARLPVIPGPRGDKGEKGDQGYPGTGDGPKGETGDQGISYDTPGDFTGVKMLDVDGVYDQVVVGLDLDAENGILTVQKSNISAGDDETPVGQVYSTPIIRDVVFDPEFPECDEGGDLWKYNITKGNDDLDENVYLYRFPDQFVAPGESEVTTMLLSEFIDAVIEDLKPEYEAAKEKYDEQIKQFILEKDTESREKLCSLAKELADCEWELPIEYCLGITPSECGSAAEKMAAALEEANEIACTSVQAQLAQLSLTPQPSTTPTDPISIINSIPPFGPC